MTHHTTATSRRLRRAVAALTGVATLATPTFAAAAPDHDAAVASERASQAPESAGARRAPNLRVNTVLRGLDHPWDVAFTPNGSMLVTERNRGRVMLRTPRGNVRTLVGNVPNLWVSGETGLMGIEVDPRFRANRRFYTCHGFRSGSTTDVRVVAWRANPSLTSAQAVDNLVTGIQVSSGRHGGCRLRFGGKGALFIGTGDAAITGSARDRTSLAGKVLRVDRFTGHALPSNPFSGSSNANTRKLFTFGHRNVQGLALRPGTPQMWSVEHGTFRDDEVNLLSSGGDYGWQAGPGYDESPPMTNFDLPGPQVGAKWSSGNPTVATSGATWLTGPRWQDWNRRLAVASLKDQSLRIMRFTAGGSLVDVLEPTALNGSYGRLRAAEMGPSNILYLTTDNGDGADRVIAVSAS